MTADELEAAIDKLLDSSGLEDETLIEVLEKVLDKRSEEVEE